MPRPELHSAKAVHVVDPAVRPQGVKPTTRFSQVALPPPPGSVPPPTARTSAGRPATNQKQDQHRLLSSVVKVALNFSSIVWVSPDKELDLNWLFKKSRASRPQPIGQQLRRAARVHCGLGRGAGIGLCALLWPSPLTSAPLLWHGCHCHFLGLKLAKKNRALNTSALRLFFA